MNSYFAYRKILVVSHFQAINANSGWDVNVTRLLVSPRWKFLGERKLLKRESRFAGPTFRLEIRLPFTCLASFITASSGLNLSRLCQICVSKETAVFRGSKWNTFHPDGNSQPTFPDCSGKWVTISGSLFRLRPVPSRPFPLKNY